MNIFRFQKNGPISSRINTTSLCMALSYIVKFWWLIKCWFQQKILLQQNFTFALSLSLPHLLIVILNLYSVTGIYTRWANSVSFSIWLRLFMEVIGLSLQLLTPFRFDWKWQKGKTIKGDKNYHHGLTEYFIYKTFFFSHCNLFFPFSSLLMSKSFMQ